MAMTTRDLLPAAGHSKPVKLAGSVAPRARGHLWKLSAVLGLGLAGLGVRLLPPRHEGLAHDTSRMIVVQSPERRERDVPLAAVAQPEPERVSAPSTTKGAADESSTIARQLARRQVALQGCFRDLSSGEAEQDPITMSFDVAASGHVTAATLEPLSLAETAVGKCLLRVARETEFQALHHALHFSVPLRARATAK